MSDWGGFFWLRGKGGRGRERERGNEIVIENERKGKGRKGDVGRGAWRGLCDFFSIRKTNVKIFGKKNSRRDGVFKWERWAELGGKGGTWSFWLRSKTDS